MLDQRWLLPLAASAFYLPEYSGVITIVALAPLMVVAFMLGAGRESATDTFKE